MPRSTPCLTSWVFSYEDLLEIKNFGSKSADEVIEALERIGISIPQSRTSA